MKSPQIGRFGRRESLFLLMLRNWRSKSAINPRPAKEKYLSVSTTIWSRTFKLMAWALRTTSFVISRSQSEGSGPPRVVVYEYERGSIVVQRRAQNLTRIDTGFHVSSSSSSAIAVTGKAKSALPGRIPMSLRPRRGEGGGQEGVGACGNSAAVYIVCGVRINFLGKFHIGFRLENFERREPI